MCTWRLQRHHPVPARLLHVNPFSDLIFLENAEVNICLQHPAQGGLQSPILTVFDVMRPKTDQMYYLLPIYPTSPRRTSRTTTHTQLMAGVLSSTPHASPYPPPSTFRSSPPCFPYVSSIHTPIPTYNLSFLPVCPNLATSVSRTL